MGDEPNSCSLEQYIDANRVMNVVVVVVLINIKRKDFFNHIRLQLNTISLKQSFLVSNPDDHEKKIVRVSIIYYHS
ncbi:hypothetical protein BLOT_004382 [Blomia tropicalis]|nr:hypothetical protein BLOT_004382 [Blomia tropicalis]